MRYTYIRLDGYKRFSLNGIDHFEMTITEPLQLIIGTNGSGKSSLMHELSPLPPNPADFAKTGSKVLKIEHGGASYVLKSVFLPSPKHSFERDGVELNEGKTPTVQRDLALQYFGIDNDIHGLIQGFDRFTQMGPSQRKEWFLRLCDTNYDYAIKVYNRLRERHRDATGAIKLARKKLVEESEKLIQSDEEERLLQEAKALHECLSHLLEHRKPVEKDADNLAVQQGQLDDMLTRAARSLQGLAEQNKEERRDLATLDEHIAEANDERSRCQALMEKHNADFLSNERKIEALRQADQQTIGTLQEGLKDIVTRCVAINATLLVPESLPKARAALEAFQTVRTQLLEVFGAIPSNKEKTYSQQILQDQKENLREQQTLKTNLLEKLQAKEHRRKHMETHKDRPDLQCPSCNHRFSLNYNEKEYVSLEAQIIELKDRLANDVQIAITQIEAYIAQCSEYSQLYRQYMQCANSWPILKPYWDYLQDQRVVTDMPEQGLHYITLIERDLVQQVEIHDLSEQGEEKRKLILSLKDVGSTDLNTLVAQNEELQAFLTDETSRLRGAIQRLEQTQAAKQRFLSIQACTAKVSQIIQQKRQLNKEEIETQRRHHFNAAIRQVQSALATREHTLNSLSLQKGIVAHIEQQIFDLQKDEEALAILVKQMSPTEGLIAEGLLGFIRNFVHQMNSFIRKIWSYSLTIQSCDVVEGASVDLDYRFPMQVEHNAVPVKDVAMGSEGMKEVVDLAFRLIAMKCLHLQDSPLMLDEFAKTFDPVHRSAATLVIKTLVEQSTFPQLFMISHYESSYGALTNAEICVLSSLNITVPKSSIPVNSHVVMD